MHNIFSNLLETLIRFRWRTLRFETTFATTSLSRNITCKYTSLTFYIYKTAWDE